MDRHVCLSSQDEKAPFLYRHPHHHLDEYRSLPRARTRDGSGIKKQLMSMTGQLFFICPYSLCIHNVVFHQTKTAWPGNIGPTP